MDAKIPQKPLKILSDSSASNTALSTSFAEDISIELDKTVRTITDIANLFEDSKAPDLTRQQYGAIHRRLNNHTSADLKIIQQALLSKGIAISGSLPQMKSTNTRTELVKSAIIQRKRLSKNADGSTADLKTVTCPYFERNNYDYFSVTKEGDVICLVPFMACDENGISSENTCQTGATMKEALQFTHERPKILKVLDGYLEDLRKDLNLLEIWNHQEVKSIKFFNVQRYLSDKLVQWGSNPIAYQKIKRFLQLEQYKEILERILNDPEFKASLDTFKNLPKAISATLATSNAVSFLMAPQQKPSDVFVERLSITNLFSLERDRYRNSLGFTVTNPKYATGFVVALQKKLRALSAAKLTQKNPIIPLPKKELLAKIFTAYNQLLTKDGIAVASPVDIFLKSGEDTARLRAAVLVALKELLPIDTYKKYEEIVKEPYFDIQSNSTLSEDRLFNLIVETYGYDLESKPNECPTLVECLEFILDDNQQSELTKQEEGSPFDELTVTSPAYYNELIQLFLAKACLCYHEYTYTHGSSDRINFGKIIESDQGTTKKYNSLITAIENALNTQQKQSSLEEVILDWLENNILSAQQNTDFKKFKPDTKLRIKKLFRAEWRLFYNPDSPAPHLDNFLITMANAKDAPIAVNYRGASSLPLEYVCKHYTAAPELSQKFKPSDFRINLPLAKQIILEPDATTVPSCSSVASLSATREVPDVMAYMIGLISQDPAAVARFLLSQTIAGKVIYNLLSESQINTIAAQKNWPAVLNHIFTLFPAAEIEKFKQKFDIKKCIHITREHERALYGEYINKGYPPLIGLQRDARIQKIIEMLYKSPLSTTKYNGNFTITKTPSSTYTLEFQTSIDKGTTKDTEIVCSASIILDIENIYTLSSNCLIVTPEMAQAFYIKVNDNSEEKVDLSGASFNRGSFSSMNFLSENSKFVKAIKALFPNLTVLVQGLQPLPDETLKNPDVIVLSYNPNNPTFGYQVTSANSDNINCIFECYESTMFHVLPPLEIGKILQAWISRGGQHQELPLALNALNLESALDALGIVYTSVVEMDSTFQIVCDKTNWDKLIKEKGNIINVDAKLVHLGQIIIPDEIITTFFAAIRNANINEAKQLLSEYPKLLNIKDLKNSNYQPTPLIYAITFATVRTDNRITGYNKELIDFCLYLLEQPGIELGHVDTNGNTVLHKTIYYAHLFDKLGKVEAIEAFDRVTIAFWELARKEGLEKSFLSVTNTSGESIYIGHDTYGHMKDFDPNNRVKDKIAKQSFWNLLQNANFFKANETIDYITSLNYDADSLKVLVNTKAPNINKFLLQFAIEHGEFEAVKALTTAGANVNAVFDTTDSNEFTQCPIGLAIALRKQYLGTNLQKTYEAIISNLMGANNHLINTKLPSTNKFLLQIAIERGEPDTVCYLMNLGHDPRVAFEVTASNPFTKSPLSLAFMLMASSEPSRRKDYTDVVHFLIHHRFALEKEQINAKLPGTNKYVLQLAIEQGDLYIVQFLLSMGVNIDTCFEMSDGNEFTQCPLGLAFVLAEKFANDGTKKQALNAIISLLTNRGATLNVKNILDNIAEKQAAFVTELSNLRDVIAGNTVDMAKISQEMAQVKAEKEAILANLSPAVKAQLQASTDITAENSELDQKLKALTDRNTSLTKNLTSAVTEVAQLEEKINSQLKQAQLLTEDISKTIDTIKQRQNELFEKQKQLSVVEAENSHLEKTLSSTSEKIAADKKLFENLTKEHGDLQTKLHQKEADTDLLHEKIIRVEAEIPKITQKFDPLQESLVKLQMQLVEKQQELSEAQNKQTAIQKQLLSATKKFLTLSSKLKQLESENLKADVLLRSEQREMNEISEERQKVTMKKQNLTQQLQGLSSEITQLQTQLKSETAVKTGLDNQLQNLKSEKNSHLNQQRLFSFLLFILLGAICLSTGIFIGESLSIWPNIFSFFEAVKTISDWGIGVVIASGVASAVVTTIIHLIKTRDKEAPSLVGDQPAGSFESDLTISNVNEALRKSHTTILAPSTTADQSPGQNIITLPVVGSEVKQSSS